MTSNLFENNGSDEQNVTVARNAPPELSVSELSHQLKRLVEGKFSFVRVRGEISKVTIAKSGHLYTALKDADSVLDAVCWKATVARLDIKPEEGLEVVCTGRLTTYPGRSNYQLIIETMELAGQGVLLRMLEERRKKLEKEGLFDPARKKPIPYLPRVIGVVTSPTGAVIRDILHRLSERFPVRVLLWPVMVQGQGAAAQVSAAIQGFNALPEGSPDRPDLLIVARGGGSLEDLMPFNDESVVRAAAASGIPLISAVGHETDTTLIDYAADLRAPTPTAAAEKAVPVRLDLLGFVSECERRLFSSVRKQLQQSALRIEGLARGLGDPVRRMENATQKLDHLSTRLDNGLAAWLERRAAKLREVSAKLSPRPLLKAVQEEQRSLNQLNERLIQTMPRHIDNRQRALQNLGGLLDSLSFKKVLERGYAVVLDEQGNIVSNRSDAQKAETLDIRWKDGDVRVKPL